MELLVIFLGCLFLVFDTALLKHKEAGIYEHVFRFSIWQTALGALLLFIAALASGEKGIMILQVIFFTVLCVYALRRKEFYVFASVSPASPDNPPDEKRELALSTFSIFGIWTLIIIAVSLFLELLFSTVFTNADELTGSLLLSEISVIVLLVLIYQSVRKQSSLKFFEVLGLETRGLGPLKTWILPAVMAFAYALISGMILDARPVQPVTPLQELLDSTSSLGVLLFFVGAAVLTAPFFEEVIFRGFLFYVMRPFKGLWFTVIFVSLLFGAMHVDQYWGDWAAIGVVFFFGLSLTLLRAWTESSIPSMVAHYVYNASLIILPMIMVIIANPMYFDYQMNYYRLNEVQKEEKLLASISQNPKFGESYNDLAWLYAEQGIKLDRALELIEKGLAIEPRNYAFLDTKAEVLFKMGRVNEAIAIAKDLVEKYPKDTYLQDQLKKFESGRDRPVLENKAFDI